MIYVSFFYWKEVKSVDSLLAARSLGIQLRLKAGISGDHFQQGAPLRHQKIQQEAADSLDLNWGSVTRNWGRWPSGCWALHGSSWTVVGRSRLLRREVQPFTCSQPWHTTNSRQGTREEESSEVLAIYSEHYTEPHLSAKEPGEAGHRVPLGLMGKGPVGHCYMFPFCT